MFLVIIDLLLLLTTIVRARDCAEFRERDASDMLQLEQVLSQFRTELERRGRLEPGEQISRL